MNKKPQTQSSQQTGPLNPAQVGQFTFRDGVWYLKPSTNNGKQPNRGR